MINAKNLAISPTIQQYATFILSCSSYLEYEVNKDLFMPSYDKTAFDVIKYSYVYENVNVRTVFFDFVVKLFMNNHVFINDFFKSIEDEFGSLPYAFISTMANLTLKDFFKCREELVSRSMA